MRIGLFIAVRWLRVRRVLMPPLRMLSWRRSFAAYHERGMDISDPDALREIAADVGVSGDKVDGWLGANPAVVDEEAPK